MRIQEYKIGVITINMKIPKYIYNGAEVTRTGRIAYKKSRSLKPIPKEKRLKIVEISYENRLTTTPNQWVAEDELYEIDGEKYYYDQEESS